MRYHAFEPDPAEPGPLAFDFDRDPARLAPAAARIGFEAALEDFAARDGRLIVWHGWADESLQPAHTLDWWRRAQAANGGAAELDRFARLFMLPGVQHCGGGPGAGDVDWLTALERWVEDDQAPDALVAWRTKESVPATVRPPRFPPVGEVVLKRPVFPYPAVARYRGAGDPLDPASFAPWRPGDAPPAAAPAAEPPPPATDY
jgi:feruloyl esterase